MRSFRALKREREFLAKRLTSRLTVEERDALYIKWEIPLDGKQRKMQFVNKLWTDPHDARHVQESAEIVAKLVGFCESGNLSKEMFELNFVLPSDRRPWLVGWNQISNLLHLWSNYILLTLLSLCTCRWILDLSSKMSKLLFLWLIERAMYDDGSWY